MKIFKYPVPILDEFKLNLPVEAKILSFQAQDNDLFIWCLVDEYNEKESRVFQIFGTGHDIQCICGRLIYIGTAQQNNFVWHLFERVSAFY